VNCYDIYKVIKGIKDKNKVPFEFKENLHIKNPLGSPFRLPFSKSGDLPIFKIPALSLSYLKVKEIGLTGADLLLALKIKNPNSFSFTFDDFSYAFSLGSLDQLYGSALEKKVIKEGKGGLLELPVHVDFLGLGLAGHSILSGKQVDYEFRAKTRIATPWAGVDLPYRLKGKIGVRQE